MDPNERSGPPAGGYGLHENPYAAPGASVESATPLECPQATLALRYALVGLVCFGVILGPLAISNALEAKRIIARSPGMRGLGKANAALVIGIVDLALFAGGLLLRLS